MSIFFKIIIFISSYLVAWRLYIDVLFFRFHSYLGEYGSILEKPIVGILILFCLGSIIFLTLLQLIQKKFDKRFIYIFYTIYFASLFFFLFLKSIGVQRINLNPLTIYHEFFGQYALETVFNIIYFIPLGLLLGKISSKKFILFTLIGLFCIEGIQFVAHLGFFDINDIILNFVGLYIGRYVACIAKENFQIKVV